MKVVMVGPVPGMAPNRQPTAVPRSIGRNDCFSSARVGRMFVEAFGRNPSPEELRESVAFLGAPEPAWPSLAEAMIKAVKKACPIEPSPRVEERECINGIIRPDLNPDERELWPESIYLQVHHTRLSYTIESPSALPLETRLAALRTALRSAINLSIRPR